MSKTENNKRSRGMLPSILAEMKKSLPSICTLLSPYTNKEGKLLLMAKVDGTLHYYSFPEDYVYTEQSFNYTRGLILDECDKVIIASMKS